MDLNPIFLVSLGRTGTTMTMRALGSHPEVVAVTRHPCEVRLAQYWSAVQNRCADLDPALAPASALYEATRNEARSMSAEFLRGEDDAWRGFAVERIRAFYAEVAATAGRTGAAWFLEKFLFNPALFDACRDLFPGLRAVLLVRDPRDMVLSIMRFNRKRGGYSFQEREGDTDLDLLRRFEPDLERITDWWEGCGTPALEARYEDLVEQPAATLERLFGGLGVRVEPAVVRGAVDALRRRGAEERRHMTSRSAAESVGTWRQQASPQARGWKGAGLVRFLERFGYG